MGVERLTQDTQPGLEPGPLNRECTAPPTMSYTVPTYLLLPFLVQVEN